MNTDNLHIPITGDNQGFINALKGAREGVRTTAREIEQSGMSIEKMFNRIQQAAALSLAGFSAKEFIQKVVSIRGEFQQLDVAFKTMLGSAEKADALMKQITKTAAITPFDLKGVADGAKQLLAYGIAADEVNDTLVRLGDIAAGLSLPLGDLVYLYGTTLTQGRMFTQDLRQFMGRGIPIAEELAKQFGVTKDKVGELVTAGKVGAEEFKKAIISMSSEGGKFGGLMEEQSKTITGQISNIEDAIDVMFNNIGKNSEGIINNTLSVVSSLVENYEKVGQVIGGVIATYGIYKAAIMTATAMQALQTAGVGALTVAETVHYGWITLVQKAQALLNATMLANPYVFVATALAGLVAVMVTMKSQQDMVNEATDEYNRKKEEAIKLEEEHNAKISKLCQVAGDESLSTESRRLALVQLEQQYPSIFAKYDTEADKLANILAIKREIAALDGQNSLKNPVNERNSVEKRIKELEAIKTDWFLNSAGHRTYTGRNRTSEEEAELTALKKRREELSNQIKKNDASTYLTNLTGISNDDLQKQINERRNLLAQMSVDEKKYGRVKFGGATGVFNETELKGQLQILESEQNRRNEKKYTPQQRKQELFNDLQKARKALADFDKTSTKYTKSEAEEARKKLQEAVDDAEKKYKAFGGSVKSGSKSNKEQAERERNQAAYEAKQREFAKRKENLEENLSQSFVDIETNTKARELAQLRHNHKQEMDEFDNEKQEYIRKKIELEESKAKADGKKYTKPKNPESVLTEEEANRFSQLHANILKKQQKETEDFYKEEKEAMNNYLLQYGDYEQKKLAITQKYEAEMNEAKNEGDKLLLKRKMEEELDELEVKYGKAKTFLIDLFEDTSKKSVKEIQKIIDKYEALVAFLKGDHSKEKRNKLISEFGFTDKEIDKAIDKLNKEGITSMESFTERIKGLKEELADRSPWQKFNKSIGEALDMLKKSKGDDDKIGTAISNIGVACREYLPEVERFSTGIHSIFGVDDSAAKSAINAISGLSTASEGIGQIISGNYLDGIVNTVDGLAQSFNSLADMITDLTNSRNMDSVYAQIELEAIRKSVDKILEKMQEGTMAEAIDEYTKAMERYNEGVAKAQQNVQDAFSESSSSLKFSKNHHSINYYMNEIGGQNELDQINRLLGTDLHSFSELWFLSPDQLAEIEEKLPYVFAIIEKGIEEMSDAASASSDDEWAREALAEYMEYVGKKKEIEDAFNQKMTGMTLDSIENEFKSSLEDMETDTEAFSENFEEMMKRAIINSMMSNTYSERLKAWYQAFSDAMSNDGSLSDSEVSSLRDDYKAIYNAALAEREQLLSMLNLDNGNADVYDQDVSKGAWASIGEETAQELNGRFTALQISGEKVAEGITSMVEQMTSLYALAQERNTTVVEIRNLMIYNNAFLEDILKANKEYYEKFEKHLDKIEKTK